MLLARKAHFSCSCRRRESKPEQNEMEILHNFRERSWLTSENSSQFSIFFLSAFSRAHKQLYKRFSWQHTKKIAWLTPIQAQTVVFLFLLFSLINFPSNFLKWIAGFSLSDQTRELSGRAVAVQHRRKIHKIQLTLCVFFRVQNLSLLHPIFGWLEFEKLESATTTAALCP